MSKKIIGILAAVCLTVLMTGCGCKHEWIPPTCVSGGICSICGETSGNPIGHSWEEADCVKAETCSVCDKKRGEALGHNWVEATCLNAQFCYRCELVEGDALGHTWNDANCVQPMMCEICGATEGESLGHSFGEYVTVIDSSCVAVGEAESTCNLCGSVMTIELPMIEHDLNEWITVKKATCESEGIKEQKCANCEYLVQESILINEHSVGKWTTKVKATCGKDGLKVASCKDCGKIYEEIIPKTEKHQFGKWKTEVNPTCTVAGTSIRSCKNCDFTESALIKATGHDYQDGVVKEATYYDKGLKGKVCTGCGDTTGETTEYIGYNKISLRTIFDDFRKNEISANDKYVKMHIEFSGKISDIEEAVLSYGKVYLEVNNNTYWKDEVECKIKTSALLEQVKKLSVGDQVTIRGKIALAGEYALNRYLIIDIIEIK